MTLICLCGYAHEHPVLELFPRFCARCGACWRLRLSAPAWCRLAARDRTVGSCAATNGSATAACLPAWLCPAPPQPIFRPSGGHNPAAGRALSRLASLRATRSPAQGLALTA